MSIRETCAQRFVACVCTLWFVVASGSARAVELPHASIGAMTQVSSARVTRVLFDYTYRVQLVNDGPALTGVVATVSSRSPNTVIRDADVTFGDVPANTVIVSGDTFTLRQDRQFPFNPADLVWTFTAGVVVNSAPIANAGTSRAAFTTDTVVLDGSQSADADGDALIYTWTFAARPAGSAAALNDANVARPRFVADVVGDYVVRLVVSDGALESAPVEVRIAVAQKTVVVPDLVGLPVDETDAALIAAGLLPGVITSEASASVRASHVIRQSPAPGEVVLPGSRVNRVFSTGGGWVNCPVTGVPLAARCVVEDGDSKLEIIASFLENDVLSFQLSRGGVVHLREQGLETFDLATGEVTDDRLALAQYNPTTRGIRLNFIQPQLFFSDALIYLDDTDAGSKLSQFVTLVAFAADFRTRAVVLTDFTLDGLAEDGVVLVDGGHRIVQLNGATAATFEVTGLPSPDAYETGPAAELAARFQGEDLFQKPANTTATDSSARATVMSWDLMLPRNAGATIRGVTTIYAGTGEALVVPDAVGRTEVDASGLLESSGLAVGSIVDAPAADALEGHVLRQLPEAGATVPRGFPVDLTRGAVLGGIPVPNVVGQPRGLADPTLRFSGLETGNVRYVASSATVGSVRSQSPAAGTLVDRGARVDISVSSGLFVPYVQNLPLAEARSVLEGAGYQVGTVADDRSSLLPVGVVSGQQPAAGFAAQPGTAVALAVAAEVVACPCTVPDLSELARAEAEFLIDRAGLYLGTVAVVAGSGYPAGTVISQSIDAGSVVGDGTMVDLVVAEDEGFVTCPSLGSVYTCRVQDGDAVFTLVVDVARNEILDYDLGVAGTRQVADQSYFLFDDDGEAPESAIQAPQVRTSTATVRVAEDFQVLRGVTTIDLRRTGNGAQLEAALRFVSDATDPLSGKIFALTDFDLAGSPREDGAFMDGDKFVAFDGNVVGSVIVAPTPDSHQIALAGEISTALRGDAEIDLDPSAILLRGGDFEHAYSWNVEGLLPGASFEVTALTEVSTTDRQPVAPSISSQPVESAREDELYTYLVTGTKQSIDVLLFALVDAPAGMSIDERTGLISWTPTNDQTGGNEVVVTVQNADGLSASQAFTVMVENVNDPPSIVSAPRPYVRDDDIYTHTVTAVDVDLVDSLEFELRTAPAGMTIDRLSGEIEWTPPLGGSAAVPVEVVVRDAFGGTSSQAWTIEVDPIERTVPVLLDGDEDSLAISAVRDYFAAGGIREGDWSESLEGSRVALNLLRIKLDPTATVGAVNDLLRSIDGGIVGMLAETDVLTVQFPARENVDDLDTLAAMLAGRPEVALVVPVGEIEPTEAPSGLPVSSFDNHIAARLPAAWNLRRGIREEDVPTVAVVDYFGRGFPRASTFNVRVVPESSVTLVRDPESGAPAACGPEGSAEHGYNMLSLISAPFGGDAIGAYQGPRLPVALLDLIAGINVADLTCERERDWELRARKMIRDSDAKILNLSLRRQPPCFRFDRLWQRLAANSQKWYRGSETLFLDRVCIEAEEAILMAAFGTVGYTAVVSAGNQSAGDSDRRDARRENLLTTVARDGLERGFVVENRKSVVGSPGFMRFPGELHESSNRGGDISAVGSGTFTNFTRPSGIATPSQGCEQRELGEVCFSGGTSSAAAQVTGFLAFLYAQPRTSPKTIGALNDLVRRTAVELGDSGAPVLDAYAALLAEDELNQSVFQGSARHRILDLAEPFAVLDKADLDAIVAEARSGQTFSRADFNGNGELDFTRKSIDPKFNLDRSLSGPNERPRIRFNEFAFQEYFERSVSDAEILCYYVNESAGNYSGSQTEVDRRLRDEGLLPCYAERLRSVEIWGDGGGPLEWQDRPGRVLLQDFRLPDSAPTFACGERGGPVWSSFVTRPAEFYQPGSVMGVPWDSRSINAEGCSSFVALRNFLDKDAGGNSLAEVWINATATGRLVQTVGGLPVVTEKEFQVRVYSGELGRRSETKVCEVGSSFNSGNYLKAFDVSSCSFDLVFDSGSP